MITVERDGGVAILSINRPEVRNAVDDETARALHDAALECDRDEGVAVIILTGAGGHFCAGADLKAVAEGRRQAIHAHGIAPMGLSRLTMAKPVIAAIEGYAVAGGLELALWCDMRVVAKSAVFGVFCRRFGVPLIDLGTIRLPRLIGQSRAMDMILTGRAVGAEEALSFGLANRVVEDGQALEAALHIAHDLARFPQNCLRGDRLSVLQQWELSWEDATLNEFEHGMKALSAGETQGGAQSFTKGQGRHGVF